MTITICIISIHALLAESDLWVWTGGLSCDYFYPRSPCGERRGWTLNINGPIKISIHALLAESDEPENQIIAYDNDFYPRSPCGERPPVREIIQWEGIFLSTLSLRRATTRRASRQQPAGISIHALLAESDSVVNIINNVIDHFYPRSPCGERRKVPLISIK